MKNTPITLAIDTSCDETSASVVSGAIVLSNIQPSQMEFHKKFGGVVPSLAKLAHIDRIDNVVNEALKRAGMTFDEIDTISVTYGPGLAIALEVGITKAKELAEKYNKPLVIVNHMEGHLLSGFAMRESKNTNNNLIINQYFNKYNYPALGVLISGGHTELILVTAPSEYEKIGETLDDSCGECLDKCGRMLGLGYPAGPIITEFAKKQDSKIDVDYINRNQSLIIRATDKEKTIYELPVPMANSNDLNMSFSGLKTAFKQLVNQISETEITIEDELNERSSDLSKNQVMNLCVVLEKACFEQIAIKLRKAIKEYEPKEIWLGGGVIASARLRAYLRKEAKRIKLRYPYSKKLTTDNAAMIGIASNLSVLQLINLENTKISKENSATLLDHGIFINPNDFSQIDRDPSLSL